MNYFKSVLVGVAAFVISVFLFDLAAVFAGRAADFIMFSHFHWILTILAPLVLMTAFYLRTRRYQKTRTAYIKR
jgi:membrane protein DedA with SNARE-associated domain